MAASLKGKRTLITTLPYQVPSVDITPDPPIFSLVTTFNEYDELRIFCPALLKHKKMRTDEQDETKNLFLSYIMIILNITG